MKTGDIPSGVRGLVSGVIYMSDSTQVEFDDSDIASGSTQFEFGVSNSGEFTVGAAIISAAKFTLLNDTGRFDVVNWVNSYMDIYVTVGDTKVDMGRFYTVDHNGHGHTIAVEAYDALKILDEFRLYELNITWPSTAKTLLNAVSAFHSITYTGLDGMADIPIDDPGDDTLTERATVAYIAQMYGKYVTWNRGEISFGWYDMSNVHSVGMCMSHSLRTDDVTIGGVRVETGDGKTTKELGDGYMVSVGSNPFVQAGNINIVAQNVFLAVNGITYRPGSAELVSTPAVEAGDVISVDTVRESGIVTIVGNLRYKPSAVKLHVSAEAEEYVGDLRLKHAAYIKKQANDNLNDQLNDPNSALSKRLGGTVWPPPTVYPVPSTTPVLAVSYGSTPLMIAFSGTDGTTSFASIYNLGITPNGPITLPAELVGVGWNGISVSTVIKGNIAVPCDLTFNVTPPTGWSLPNGGTSLTIHALVMFQKYSEIKWTTDNYGNKALVLKLSGDPLCQGIAIPFYKSSKKTIGFAMFFDNLGGRIGDGIMQLTILENKSMATVVKTYS